MTKPDAGEDREAESHEDDVDQERAHIRRSAGSKEQRLVCVHISSIWGVSGARSLLNPRHL
jgi:hypothetical protein